MGCSESVPVAPGGENALGVIQSSPIDVNQSQQWKVKPTRSEAKKAYIADGSLTESNADKLVEIRTLLDDPMFLGGLGEFSKHVHKYELLALWADILEYKEMDAKSNEMMLSQALHVYHKYIKVSNADDDAHTTSERAPAVCPFLPEDAENLRVTLIDAASKAALGDEASPNISDAADTDGIAGADAGAGTDGISGADAGTGTDGIAGADADAGTDGNENLLSLHLLDVFQQTCVECIYKDLFLPFAGTDTYKSLAAKMKKAYNCVVADNFEYVGLIGSGSFGIVVHAIKKSTKKHYAMKIQRKVGLLETFSNCMERVVSEKEAVASCHHPFIVSMDYAFQSTGLVFMVMDLGTTGTLNDSLLKSNGAGISVPRIQFYTAEIVLALAHIHKLGMIYRDLKPQNILLKNDGHIQLVDMGGIVDVSGKLISKPTANSNGGGQAVAPSNLFDKSYAGRSNGNDKNKLKKVYTETASFLMNSLFPDSVTSEVRGVAAGSHYKPKGSYASLGSYQSQGSHQVDMEEGSRRDDIYRKQVDDSNSRAEGSAIKRADSIMGTDGYMAPEMAVIENQDPSKNKGYNFAVDYWSLGVVMFKLIYGHVPFHHYHVALFLLYKTSASPDESKGSKSIPLHPEYIRGLSKLTQSVTSGHITPEIADIITKFLDLNEKTRLGSGKHGITKVRHHKFFHGIKWNKLFKKHLVPPYLPDPAPARREECFDSFQDLMTHLNIDWWLNEKPGSAYQGYFQNWDFIAAEVLKTEMGITAENDMSNAKFKKSVN